MPLLLPNVLVGVIKEELAGAALPLGPACPPRGCPPRSDHPV